MQNSALMKYLRNFVSHWACSPSKALITKDFMLLVSWTKSVYLLQSMINKTSRLFLIRTKEEIPFVCSSLQSKSILTDLTVLLVQLHLDMEEEHHVLHVPVPAIFQGSIKFGGRGRKRT
jgi:hypothetical protein